MKTTTGYIVVNEVGQPLEFDERDGVLAQGDMNRCHMFASRRQAKRAIDLSAGFAIKHGLQWGCSQWWIMRVTQ